MAPSAKKLGPSQALVEAGDILQLLYDRVQEGSLILDNAEDHGPEDPEPIQHRIARWLGLPELV